MDTRDMDKRAVEPAEVRHALRSVRAAVYRVDTTPRGTTLTLVMNASPAGRRNAATKIVRLLAEHGLDVAAKDLVETLTGGNDGLLVLRQRN
ncbi:MAG: hypothetical protein ACRDQ5_00795 [Sciscionella sp.]